MKKLLLIGIIFITSNLFSQTENKIDSLSYAHIKIAVPENCVAKSEYELLDCEDISVQWLYLNKEMLEVVPTQFYNQFEQQQNVIDKEKMKIESYSSELNGYKFKTRNSGKIRYVIIVSGTVNNQPLLLNIGSEKNVKKTSDLSEFLRTIIEIK